MSDVQCVGTESRLIDCPYTSGGSGSLVSLECSSMCKLNNQLLDNYLLCEILNFIVDKINSTVKLYRTIKVSEISALIFFTNI